MLKGSEIHNKIVDIIKYKGPSLPIQIAKDMNMSSLFVSAFLSELAHEKRIKVSNLRVGGSPLYYIGGQEEKLENFQKFLHPKEAEAFLLLKEERVLKDSEQDPAIRVAIRSIKDFAIPFKKDEEIFWRYHLITENEITQIFEPRSIKKQEKPKPEEKQKEIEIQKPKIVVKELEKTEENPKKEKKIKQIQKPKKEGSLKTEFKNPLLTKVEEKLKKEKPKSDFVQNIVSFLSKNFKIIEEKDYNAKEYNCIIEIKTELGPVNLLTQAKDKKTISESDLKKLLLNAQTIPLSAFIVYTGELTKKSKEFAKIYSSILKTKKIIKGQNNNI